MAPLSLLDDAFELADLLTPTWSTISAGIPDWHPRLEGDPDPDPDPKPDPDPDPDPKPDPDPDDDPDKVTPDDDWKSKARKHERAAKAAAKRAEAAEAKLKERDDATKSEHEKALDQARKEARDEALSEAQKARRGDRLEVSVTRLATKGIKLGDGDDAKTAKFADPDDAIVHVERAIAKGEIDEDDIFDDEGKVNTDALTTALADLLERKTHLQASTNGRPPGDADAGKGRGPGKSADDMSVDEHLKAIKRT